MRRNHEQQLWAYASKELDLGTHRFLQAHLEDCPECVEQLAAVQVAKEALELAREAPPPIAWSQLDRRMASLVDARLRRRAKRPQLFRLAAGGVGLGLAIAAAMVLRAPSNEPSSQPSSPSPSQQEALALAARVESARGLTGASGEISDGAQLSDGDVVETIAAGRALVFLPDGSRLRLGGASRLSLGTAQTDEVELTLERGSLAVQASHQPRKAFLVHAGQLQVTVIGTTFVVRRSRNSVEVAVGEGRVSVCLPAGESTLVEAGQRVRFEGTRQNARRLKLTAHDSRELAQISEGEPSDWVEPRGAVVGSVGGPSQGSAGTLPRLSSAEARARLAQAPAYVDTKGPVAPEETPAELAPLQKHLPLAGESRTELVVEAPPQYGSPGPSAPPQGPAVAGDGAPRSQPSEWAEVQFKPASAQSPAGAARPAEDTASSKPVPKDLEAIFLLRAEESLEKGGCDRFLLGLEEIAVDAQRSGRSELARVLRARCFERQLRPRQSMSEYRKYLEEYPVGRFLPEARQALGE